MALDTVSPSATRRQRTAQPRKPRPWFTPLAAPPDFSLAEVQELTPNRIHHAVGTPLKRTNWFAAAAVFDIGYYYDDTYFGAPDRARPYLALATTYWRSRWNKTRFDLAIAPCTQAELQYYAELVSAEIAKYAFERHACCATYKAVLAGQGLFVMKYKKWGQQ